MDAQYTRSNDKAFDGSWSIKQVTASAFPNFYTDTNGIAVLPNTNYVLTFWAFITVNSGLPPLFQINTGAAFGGFTIPNTYFSLADTGGQWQQFGVDFNTGPANKIWLRIFNNNGNVLAYYDLFVLNQTTTLLSYFYGNTGNIYVRSGFSTTAQWQNLHQASSSHGNGLAYFFADDFVYYTSDSWIGRYGPISNNPQFSDNFLQSQGSVPQNTNSLSLTAASSMYADAADSASLSVTGDLTLESYFYANSLPGTGNSMTLIGKWDESTNARSYIMDIYGISGYFGDGSGSALTIAADTTEAPIDSACTGTAGSSTLTATNVSFAAGQVILIHQTQGTGAGLWERNTIQSYTAGTITTGTALKTNYTTGAQVRVVPQYTNVTINSGKTYSAKAWNGTVGGILAFLANGSLIVTGSISAAGKGFRGGAGGSDSNGTQGEGNLGTGGDSRSANGTGGGAGSWGVSSGSGGGGGSYASVGTTGTAQQGSPGLGATTILGSTDLTTMTFGGGGGGGTKNAYAGGAGGGILFITAANQTVTGGMTANGSQGAGAVGLNEGAGGGAGGSILLKGQTAELGSGLITANGAGSVQGGGTGGNGRIHLDYLSSFTGTTTPALNSTQDNTLVTTISYEARLGVSNNGTASEYLAKVIPNLIVSQWNRLSISWVAATATATFYLNAVSLGSVTGTITSISDNGSNLYIGANKAGAVGNFFDGLLDDARIWGNAQTASQISINNQIQLQGSEAGLEAYYKFNASLADSTGNANNLTGHNSPTYSTNVPFGDATTRLDIDTTGGTNASTYTLPASISEAASDTLSFTPVNDPQKSIQFTVDTAGSGNWTVTIHDQQNRLIATQTILNANVPASGLIEFTFTTPWRIVIGRTYHAHLTVSTGTSKIKATSLNNFATALYTTYFGFLVTDTDFHPIIHFLNFLVIGNERYLATWDGAFYHPNQIAFPTGWRVRTFSFWREYLAIGVWKGPQINSYTWGRVYFWDGIAPTFNFFIDVPDGQVNAIWGRDSDLFIIAGYRGDLLDYQGTYFFDTGNSSSVKIRFLPKRSQNKIVEVFPGAMNYYRNLLQVGFAGNSTMTSIFKGVYSYGTHDPKLDQTISLDYLISTGNTGSTVTIGCVYPVGDRLIIGWQDGNSFGADVVDYDNNPPAPHGRIELMFTDDGHVWHTKTDYTARADFLALRTGENVTVEAATDRENFQTGSILYSSDNSSPNTTNNFCKLTVIQGREREMQYAVNLYATGATSPTLLEVSALEDDLTEEKQF